MQKHDRNSGFQKRFIKNDKWDNIKIYKFYAPNFLERQLVQITTGMVGFIIFYTWKLQANS